MSVSVSRSGFPGSCPGCYCLVTNCGCILFRCLGFCLVWLLCSGRCCCMYLYLLLWLCQMYQAMVLSSVSGPVHLLCHLSAVCILVCASVPVYSIISCPVSCPVSCSCYLFSTIWSCGLFRRAVSGLFLSWLLFILVLYPGPCALSCVV